MRGRGQTLLLAAAAAGLYLAILFVFVRFLVRGDIYVRHVGWTTYAEHPAGVVGSVVICLIVLVGGLAFAAFACITERRSRRRLGARDPRGAP